MTRSPLRHGRHRAVALALLTATLVPGLAQLPALATSQTQAPTADLTITLGGLGDPVAGLTDLDLRGTVQPTAAQRSAARRLNAVDVRWNQFGTPVLDPPRCTASSPGRPRPTRPPPRAPGSPTTPRCSA